MLSTKMLPTFLLGLVLAVAMPSFGFIVERAAIDLPAPWSVVPSLETEQKMPVDDILNGKLQVTGMDKILQASEARKSAKQTESLPEDSSREKRSDVVIDEIVQFVERHKDSVNLSEENATASPKNIVLLLVTVKQHREDPPKDFWKDFKATFSFPVEGSLRTCRESETAWFSLDKAPLCGARDKYIACKSLLHHSVTRFLSWAQDVKKMPTGTTTDFSISVAATTNDEPTRATRQVENLDETEVKEIPKNKAEILSNWHPVDLGKLSPRTVPSAVVPFTEKEDGNGYETMWDVFDVFSRVRTAMFRTLLDILGGRDENASLERKPQPPRSIPELLVHLIKKLRAAGKERGYVHLGQIASGDLVSAVKLIRSEISARDTLLVIVEACGEEEKSVPFFAEGPSAKVLPEATSIWDLPEVLENVTGSCHGQFCRNRILEALAYHSPTIDLIPKDLPTHRIVRRDDKNADNSNAEKKKKEVDDGKQKIEPPADKNTTNDKKTRSSEAPEILPEKFSTLLSLATSVLLLATLSTP